MLHKNGKHCCSICGNSFKEWQLVQGNTLSSSIIDEIRHLLSHQWERLAQIQEIQLDLLTELSKKP